jgi:hypothetical protein
MVLNTYKRIKKAVGDKLHVKNTMENEEEI